MNTHKPSKKNLTLVDNTYHTAHRLLGVGHPDFVTLVVTILDNESRRVVEKTLRRQKKAKVSDDV